MKLGALALVLLVPAASARAQERSMAPRVLVVPFENVTREGRIFWLTEAAAVLLTDNLNAHGVNAIARKERQQAFERLQVPPAAVLSDATVIRIGQLVGAAQVVIGSLQLEGDELAVHARSIALDTGRIQADVTERGPLVELFPIFDRVARRMTPPPARSSPATERPQPPVAAFEDYIKGLLAETPATAITYLKAALTRYPPLDRARLALWDVYDDQGEQEEALAAVEAVKGDSPFARPARFLAGLSQLYLHRLDEAYATFKALADAQPTAAVLNNLGIVQLRRGATPQTGAATYFFTKAAEADPEDEDYVFNLGYAYWQTRDPQAAIYWLREAVRRNPADGDAHVVLGAALAIGGSATEASRERELARRLSSAYEPNARQVGDTVPKDLERLKDEVEVPRARGLQSRLASTEQKNQEELAAFHLDRARRLYREENDRDAELELKRAIYSSPYLADAHLLLGRIHLRNGRITEAMNALKIALWSAESAEAHAVLGEAYRQARDVDKARAEAERALALDPASVDAKQLIAHLDGR